MKKLRADAWPREELGTGEVGGVKVVFSKHPDVDAADVEVVDADIYWRDGTVSRVVLCRGAGEPVLRGCNVDAEVQCSSLSELCSGVLELLARLGVSRKTALAVEVQIW